ncbi:Polyamine aminopropyltransferase [Euphorbia peplus]|nr:Polyamine aminopropyltransferase [Euphorbia peplus]
MWSFLRSSVSLFIRSSNNSEEKSPKWFEEQLEDDLKWSFQLNSMLHATTSEYQDIVLMDSKPFGKVLVLDGKLQSAEKDEFIYHECLVHPALLLHPNPKSVFIMGGGEGSTAREVLKHKGAEKVVMCDIDKVVVDFCRKHLTENQQAFRNHKLHLVYNDAKSELEKRNEKYDVIIGDLADPIEGGPCNHLYTKSFYEQIIKTKLNPSGIFVTQAGPAGMLSHKFVFTPIYNTVKQVFKHVIAFTAHVPSYADSAGWVLASDEKLNLDVAQLDKKIRETLNGELRYLDGASIVSSTKLNKTFNTSIANETHVFTEEDARVIHGHGIFL